MIYFVIPAREGSKGLPGKNRILFDYTANIIPDEFNPSTIVVTDDEKIGNMAGKFSIVWHEMGDLSNMRDVLIHVARERRMSDDDIIVMLYLTYPERRFVDVMSALDFFVENGASSLLCRKDVKTHPYMCIYANGRPVVDHDYYRRQDYPSCYEISHFIAIVKVGELPLLKRNLYNGATIFIDVPDFVDVDTKEDLDKCENASLHR